MSLPLNNYFQMKKLILFFILVCCMFSTVYAQSDSSKIKPKGIKYILPKSSWAMQYAGSIGFASVGYFRQTQNEKIELGFLYGHTPQKYGGPLNSLTLKLIYNPFKIKLSNKVRFEPIQTGLFITGWFGENTDISWSSRYPKGYYFWQSNMRKHIFVSSQFSLLLHRVERVSLCFEANTNDLYMYTYAVNKNLSLSDIIFYGIGLKIYMN
jgi:hypothetical protein